MAKLFVSYVGLVSHFCHGEIDEFDLNSGFFYLGRIREEVITSNGVPSLWPFWQLPNDPVTKFKTHKNLSDLLKQADAEDRVCWRVRGKSPSYAELNDFLNENREGRIPLELAGFSSYSCPGVAARVRAAGLLLDVVY